MQVELGEIGAKTASILDFQHFVSNTTIEKAHLWGVGLSVWCRFGDGHSLVGSTSVRISVLAGCGRSAKLSRLGGLT